MADGLPAAGPHGLLSAVAGEFAVEELARPLLFAEQRVCDADAVDVGRRAGFFADQVEQRRHPVLETGHKVGGAAGLYFARPANDERHAHAALVQRALEAAQRLDALEEVVVHLGLQVRGAVVGREHDDRVFGEAKLVDEAEQAADVAVHPRDHRGVRGARGEVRRVAVALGPYEWRVVPLLREIRREFLVRHVQRDVRDDSRVVEKKRPVPVFAEERQRLLVDAIRRVILSLENVVAARVARVGVLGQRRVARHRRVVVQRDALEVAPEVIRIIAVRVALAVVAEKPVEALVDRVALRAGKAESPFAERAGAVAVAAQQLGDRLLRLGDGPLAFRFHFAVVAYEGVPGMFAGDEHAARRRADGVAAVVAREAHALRGQAVEVWRLDFFLPVAAQLRVAEVVGEDEDDVRPGRLGLGGLAQAK